MERLIAKHPELVMQDTINIKDTVITPSVIADTSIGLRTLTDTLILRKENLEVKVMKMHDTLYISGNCKSDTIYKTIKVPVMKVKIIKPDKIDALIDKLPWIVIAGIMLILLIIFLVLRRA